MSNQIRDAAEKLKSYSFDDYCAIEKINSTGLKKSLKSWRSFRNYMVGDRAERTEFMRRGNWHHSMILEPELFEETFTVMPDFAHMEGNVKKVGKRTEPSTSANTSFVKENKRLFELKAIEEDREVITREAYDSGLSMVDALWNNEVARECIEGSAKEVTLFGEIEDVPCKCRIDLCSGVLADLKSTFDASVFRFGKTAANFDYGFQLSFYRELYRQNFAHDPACWIIAVESKGDFECAVYEMPVQLLDDKFQQVVLKLREYKECLETGVWPGVDRGQRKPIPMFVPNWAMDADDGLDWSDVDG